MEKHGIEKLLEFVRMQNAFRLVERVTYANGTDRMENDTEHSYNLAMLAWYVADSEKLDLDRNLVVKYALIHDLAEVYAGDTYIYSEDQGHLDSKAAREHAALERLEMEFPGFTDFHELVDQYESRKDRESRFVYALDKIQPVLHAFLDDGRIWREKNVTIAMLHDHKKDKVALSPEVKPYFDELIALLKENENRLFGKGK
ncbi:MAG: HD domain-containing protein [Candidatus Moranbacteria bacterium]|nr:HD domain-containing protein [Candidatus Moranbacteria bacterium]